MLIQELKNQLLRIVAWAVIGLGLSLLLVCGLHFVELSPVARLWGVALIGLGVAIHLLVWLWPGRNFAPWVLMLFILGMNLFTIKPEIESSGSIQVNALMLFPILAFFLVGKWRGLILCLVQFLLVVALLPFYDWDLQIYGKSGVVFLLLFGMAISLSFILAIIHERHLERIAEISMTDSITGLPNRGGFLVLLRASVQTGMPFQLVMMDIDHFRRINMVLGAKESDHVLKRISEILSFDPDIRDLARDYGDEFVWIHEGTPERLEGICETIQKNLRKLSDELQLTSVLTASFGATVFPKEGKTHTELWTQSELALKKAKQQGRRCLRFYVAKDSAFERAQGELLGLLEHAIQQKKLQVHFQPKVCLDQEMVCGMEALVRWVDEERGFIPPTMFIPIAEQVGLIHSLGDLVNEITIEFLGRVWREGYSGMSVSINISPSQLLKGDLCTKLIGICMRNEVPSSAIILEITEGVLANPEMRSVIQELRDNGFQISLDDFGTGYSSLSYLHHFPITELKIDKSFSDGLLQSEKQRRIFESIVHLSRELGLHTVVEGVEKWDQIQYILKKGKIQVQGWFFARAMPPEQFLAFVKGFNFASLMERGKPNEQ